MHLATLAEFADGLPTAAMMFVGDGLWLVPYLTAVEPLVGLVAFDGFFGVGLVETSAAEALAAVVPVAAVTASVARSQFVWPQSLAS